MSSYPASSHHVSVSADEADLPAGLTIAVRARDLVTPMENGAPLEDGGRSAPSSVSSTWWPSPSAHLHDHITPLACKIPGTAADAAIP